MLQNGVIDLSRLRAGQEIALLPHSPRLMAASVFRTAMTPSRHVPAGSHSSERSCPTQKAVSCSKKSFGYCLTSETSQQKFFMFEGSGGNGKDVVTNILTRVVGHEERQRVVTSSVWGHS